MGAFRRRATHGFSAVRARTRSAFAGLPRWAKPSNVTAATGVAVGIGELLFTPLAGGDSWVNRLKNGYATYQQTKNPMDLLNTDVDGNDASTIAVLQLKQNAGGAVLTIAGFGIGAAILKYFGM